jgi:hypothetical protein
MKKSYALILLLVTVIFHESFCVGPLHGKSALFLKDGERDVSRTTNPKKPGCRNKDMDCDGIPDRIEKEVFYSSPDKKTLFVRPLKEKEECESQESEDDSCLEYWEEFYLNLFPGGSNGRAAIPAFKESNIEVIVIGQPDNPYKPMQKFLYNPGMDSNRPPCSILEITLKKKRGSSGWPIYPVTAEDAPHRGHIYFRPDCPIDESTSKSLWLWSTFGYASSAEKFFNYYRAYIYSYPLDRYFSEGVYESIAIGQKPVVMDCKKYPHKCNMLSPFNLNDNDPPPNPPYILKPDDTVEFNDIEFDSEGTIVRIGPRGKPYTWNQVLARTAVHEMGHALLGSVQEDHCRNPSCIMYPFIEDWDQRGFGSSGDIEQKGGTLQCKHGPGGSHDIRADGVVYNYYADNPKTKWRNRK